MMTNTISLFISGLLPLPLWAAENGPAADATESRPIYVIQHNHFDPIWRRCWDRTFDYNGMRLRSYAELEEVVFNIWLETAKRGATFSEGQAVVIRKFLERNPQRLAEMKTLAASGTFEITAAGETVADTNMPAGETLLRNLSIGIRWCEDTLDVLPTIGWLEDAFGQSAQMPQLFRGCEVLHVLKCSYKKAPGNYWKGLDGSVVCTMEAPTQWAGGQGKIPPCPVCQGFGCPECENYGVSSCTGSGFAHRGYITDDAVRHVMGQAFNGDPSSIFHLGDEESIPNPHLPELIKAATDPAQGKAFRFGTFAGMARHYSAFVAKVDDPALEVSSQVEANPVSTGCYVSRIKIKQNFRRLEHALVTAEKWATVAWLQGAEYPGEELTQAWRHLLFVAFHDAITSTHIDAAYDELMDMFAQVQEAIDRVQAGALGYLELGLPTTVSPHHRLVVYNAESWPRQDLVTVLVPRGPGRPTLTDGHGQAVPMLTCQQESDGVMSPPTSLPHQGGGMGENAHQGGGKNSPPLVGGARGGGVWITFAPPVVPPLGYQALTLSYAPAEEPVIAAGSGEIANEFFRVHTGPTGIESIVCLEDGREIVNADTFLANELLLEEDIGHPWGTQQPPAFCERLGRFTQQLEIIKESGSEALVLTGVFTGRDPLVRRLSWRQEVRLYQGIKQIFCRTEVDWDTTNRRLRVAFPTTIATSKATYAIPYGALERKPYEPDFRTLPSTNGDWPAINWVDVHDDQHGVALLNKGLPSHKVEGGVIYLSLLRSPILPWCLNEPEFYDCPDYDGARDTGKHVFEYALVPHTGDWKAAGLERLGREYNTPMVARITEANGDGSRGDQHAFLKIEASDNVIVTAIKQADRIDGAVVRFAETNGVEGKATFTLEGATGKAELVNFIERQAQPEPQGALPLKPFKIVTIQVGRGGK